MKTISKNLEKGSQSLTYNEIVEIEGLKFQIKIESDSYDFQSYANISVWQKETLSWNNVASIHHSNMATEIGLAYRSAAGVKDFSSDRKELINLAKKIVF